MRWMLLCLLLFTGCRTTVTKKNVEKIILTDSNSYSVFVLEEGGKLTEYHDCFPVVKVDVPEGAPMYRNEITGAYTSIELHIRSAEDIRR